MLVTFYVRINIQSLIPLIINLLFSGFSLAAWQRSNGVANTIPIDGSKVDNLLSDLNVGYFVSSPSCSWTNSEYSNAGTILQKRMYRNCIYIFYFENKAIWSYVILKCLYFQCLCLWYNYKAIFDVWFNNLISDKYNYIGMFKSIP